MRKYTSKELRETWLNFYKSKGHVDIGAVSLIGDGTTGVMFNVAGMQPLMPYLLGAPHPQGKRLCNVQGCVRTVDIDSVGDETHFTFFEMMGNWSLGDYFKKEKTKWTFDFLTKELGFDKDKICCSVFAGDENAPRDEQTASLLKQIGIKEENIFYLGKKDNWWELEGTSNTPCGPDNEWFYPRHDRPCCENCDITCECGRWVEIGNDVYMQYKKLEGGKYIELENKNVDTGFGFERLLMYINGYTDGYKIDIFAPVISYLSQKCGFEYGKDEKNTKAMRIIADHIRTSVMLIGDKNGIVPSNIGAGYILRRLLRRAIRYTNQLGLEMNVLLEIAKIYINDIYCDSYPVLFEKQDFVLSEIEKEANRFAKALEDGYKEFEKVINGIERKNQFMALQNPDYVPENTITGKSVFRLYDTFGFPIEMTEELALEKGYNIDKQGFEICFKEHQEKSKQQGTFKGGLANHNEMTTRLHTATHLLQAALRKVLGNVVTQKGSNITEERLRFDFSFDRKVTPEELAEVENLVNDIIKQDIPVCMEEMTYQQALNQDALGLFKDKYDKEKVKVYSVGDFSKECCGGPHAKSSGELGSFKIKKEEANGAGIRRIKAVIVPKE